MIGLALLFNPANALLWLLTVVHVFICMLLILVVLLQQRRGADLASAFGGGPSQANVAALSSEDFITKATKYGALLFMATSLVLARFPPGQGKTEIQRLLEQKAKSSAVTPAGGSGASGASGAAPENAAPPAPAEQAPAPAAPPAEPAPSGPSGS